MVGLIVKVLFAVQEGFGGFAAVWIRNTAVHRTNRGALGLFVKAFAFRAFIRDDEIDIVRDGGLLIGGMGSTPVGSANQTTQGGTLSVGPRNTAFVNRIVRTFGFAGPAINALVGDDNGHGFLYFHRKFTLYHGLPLPFLCRTSRTIAGLGGMVP